MDLPYHTVRTSLTLLYGRVLLLYGLALQTCLTLLYGLA